MRFSTQAGASGDNRGPNTLITSNFIAYEEFSTVSTLQDQGCSSSCTGGPGVSPWEQHGSMWRAGQRPPWQNGGMSFSPDGISGDIPSPHNNSQLINAT